MIIIIIIIIIIINIIIINIIIIIIVTIITFEINAKNWNRAIIIWVVLISRFVNWSYLEFALFHSDSIVPVEIDEFMR